MYGRIQQLVEGGMDANLNSQTAWSITPGLSPRELECLAWVSQGKSSTDIGAILGLSARCRQLS